MLQLISSQAEQPNSDGSETKRSDLLKVKKLQKHLEEIKKKLIKKYPNVNFFAAKLQWGLTQESHLLWYSPTLHRNVEWFLQINLGLGFL